MIGIVTSLRRALLRGGMVHAASLPRPVVSVGNLAAGGTGKTPHVAFLARRFQERGFHPCILSRGYGREGSGVLVVSAGAGVLVSSRLGGDEPVLLARLLPGVPVVVGESRWDAGTAFLAGGGEADLFLLDDGFQHLSLARDADVVLVDCASGLGNGRTLPFGPLRETARSLARADAVVVTKCPSLEAGVRRAREFPIPRTVPVGYTSLAPRRLVDGDGNTHPLPGGRWEVAAFSALAGNAQFRATLEAIGWTVRVFRGFRDHHRFTAAELASLRKDAAGLPLVTTMKDLVRIPEGEGAHILALDVDVSPLAGMDEVESVLSGKVEAWQRRKG